MTFKEVYQSNQSFRDVSHRMKELAGRLEGGVADESLDLANPAEAQKDAQKDVKKKSKISYL